MIGPKKLGAIRQELYDALARTGNDPIRWLEERIAAAERKGTATRGESEVLRSLRRLLEAPKKAKRPKRRDPTKK